MRNNSNHNIDMDQGELLSTVAIIISAGGIFLGAINHKRIRSNCFGKITQASIDIENTTPPLPKSAQLSPEPITISVQ
jgi:hypothetical protein